MTFRRLILAVLVATMTVAPVAHAQEAPTCADEHLTGADCQGPDMWPAANECNIKVWVGKASCDLIAPDGAASRVLGGAYAWGDQGTVPEMDIVVRDKATGTVLFHDHLKGDPAQVDPSQVEGSIGHFVEEIGPGAGPRHLLTDLIGIRGSVEGQFVRNTNGGFSGWLNPEGGAEVICEVTGTHSKLGAATAAAGETPDVDLFGQASPGLPQAYNNTFGCVVDPGPWSPPTISPGSHGCVARYPVLPALEGYFGSSCSFIGASSGFPGGIISTTTGTYTVSHQGPSGPVVISRRAAPTHTPSCSTPASPTR